MRVNRTLPNGIGKRDAPVLRVLGAGYGKRRPADSLSTVGSVMGSFRVNKRA